MRSPKSFKKYLNEAAEFNDKQAVKDAISWMENKYGKDLYTFQNIPGMKMEGEKQKTYDIAVGDKTYQLHLKKFDSNGDGVLDTLGFDVLPAVEPDEEEDEL
jgi:hypothetical protein